MASRGLGFNRVRIQRSKGFLNECAWLSRFMELGVWGRQEVRMWGMFGIKGLGSRCWGSALWG